MLLATSHQTTNVILTASEGGAVFVPLQGIMLWPDYAWHLSVHSASGVLTTETEVTECS